MPQAGARRVDAFLPLVVVLLAIGASTFAFHGFRAHGGVPDFYQNTFETAVFAACGHGFGARGTVEPGQLRTLDEFLALKTDRFDCADLPRHLVLKPDSWKGPGLYLFAATALVWRYAGVTWTVLDWVSIGLSAVTALVLYGLFRLVMGPRLAAAGATVMALSPLHLRNMPHLWDYAKAPFVLGALLILGLLVVRARRDALVIVLAAAFGSVVGVGYGFRADLAVLLPLGLLVVMAFLDGGPVKKLRRNALAAVVLVAAFGLAASPILRGLRSGGGCEYHVTLLGLTRPFTEALGLNPAPYEVGALYNDALMDLEIGDYASRVLHQPPPSLCSIEYEQASSNLMFHTMALLPADMLVRAYASALTIATRGIVLDAAPSYARGGLATIYAALARVTTAMAPFGIWIVALALTGLWGMDRRIGGAAFVVGLFVAGYPALQFSPRHWFHLQFIPWWAAGLLIQSTWRRGGEWPRHFILWAVSGPLVALVLLWGSLAVLRAYQAHTVTAMMQEYLAAPTEPLATGRVVAADMATSTVAWKPDEYTLGAWHRGSDLLVLTLGGPACEASSPVPVTARYLADAPAHDITASVVVPAPPRHGQPTRMYLPIFTLRDERATMLRFESIELPRSAEGCLLSVGRVVGRDVPRVRMTLVAPPDWRQHALFQTLPASPVVSWLTRTLGSTFAGIKT